MAEDRKAARERAQAYKQQQDEPSEPKPAAPKRPKTEAEWRDGVNQAIEDAMRQGDFDNLRGHGKPLNLQRDPFTPEGYELAYGILKNNDLAPGWIGARNEVQGEIERWRAHLRAEVARIAHEWIAAGASPNAQAAVRIRWLPLHTRARTELEALNRRIRDVNLQQPVSTMHLFALRLDEELHRAGLPAAIETAV